MQCDACDGATATHGLRGLPQSVLVLSESGAVRVAVFILLVWFSAGGTLVKEERKIC